MWNRLGGDNGGSGSDGGDGGDWAPTCNAIANATSAEARGRDADVILEVGDADRAFSHPHTRQDGHTPDRTQGAVQAHTAKETLEAREHARQGESTSGNQTRNAIEAHNQQPPARTEQRSRAQAASPRPAEATRCGPPLATATMAALARAITMDARSKNWC